MGWSDSRVREEIVLYIEDWFDLDRNLEPFYKLSEKNTILHATLNIKDSA